MPPPTRHGIDEARAGIARCKAALRGWGVHVEDQAHDAVPAPSPDPPQVVSAPAPASNDRHPSRTAIVTGVVAFLGAVLTNIATNVLPDSWRPYLWLAWPAALLVTAIGIVIAIRQARVIAARGGSKTSARLRADLQQRLVQPLLEGRRVDGLVAGQVTQFRTRQGRHPDLLQIADIPRRAVWTAKVARPARCQAYAVIPVANRSRAASVMCWSTRWDWCWRWSWPPLRSPAPQARGCCVSAWAAIASDSDPMASFLSLDGVPLVRQ